MNLGNSGNFMRLKITESEFQHNLRDYDVPSSKRGLDMLSSSTSLFRMQSFKRGLYFY